MGDRSQADKDPGRRLSHVYRGVALPGGRNKGRFADWRKNGWGSNPVEIDAVAVGGAWCDMQMGTEQSSGTPVTEPSGSQPWLIRAGRLQLENSAFSMKTADAGQTDLVLSGIAVQIDSVYNRGTVVRGKPGRSEGCTAKRNTAATDAGTGGSRFGPDSIEGAFIRTAHSKIELTARADTSMNNLMKRVPLIVQLNARVGLADLTPFL